MKALILSGATINSYMPVNNMVDYTGNTQYEGFSRKYGAGILNVVNSYQAFVNGKYDTFVYVSAVNPRPYVKSLYLTQNQLLRLVTTWDVPTTITGDHTAYQSLQVNVNPVQVYTVTIRTPSNIVYNAEGTVIDNKRIATFESDESGYYDITYTRINNYLPSIHHSFVLSIQDPITTGS